MVGRQYSRRRRARDVRRDAQRTESALGAHATDQDSATVCGQEGN
jgi:hypothetical protein